MASIIDKIAQIRQAVFGKDVRESIASGIEAINAEVESTTARQNAIDLNEAERISAENTRIENENNRIEEHTQQTTEVEAIKVAYDAATKANLSVEVSNARTDNINGRTYETLSARLDDTASQMAESMQLSLSYNNLVDKLELSEVFSYSISGSLHCSIQSMCITNDAIVIGTIIPDDSGTRLLKFDKNTYQLLLENTSHSFSHTNDMCYNPNTNKIYVIYSTVKKIGVVNADTLEFENDIDLSFWTYAMDYDNANNQYVFRTVFPGDVNKITTTDSNFNIISSFNSIPETLQQETSKGNYMRQGLGINDLFRIEVYSKPESLFLYDKKGNMVRRYSIPIDSNYEIETIKSVGASKWYILIAEQSKEFHVYEVDLYRNKLLSNNECFASQYRNKDINLYCDNTFLGVSDGTASKPYKSLNEALYNIGELNGYRGYITLNLTNKKYEEVLYIRSICSNLTIKGLDEYTEIKSLYMDRNSSSLIAINNVHFTDVDSNNNFCFIDTSPKVSFTNLKIKNDSIKSNAIGVYIKNSNVELAGTIEINNCLNAIEQRAFSNLNITGILTGTNNINSILATNGHIYGSGFNTIDGVLNIRYNAIIDSRIMLKSGADLNNLKYKGKYVVYGAGLGSTILNLPLVSNCLIDVEYVQSDVYLVQKVIGYTVGDIFYRFSTDGGQNWSTWIKLGGSSGKTSNRPNSIYIGYMYFDTTINKPIYWNGTSWVDSTGTTV